MGRSYDVPGLHEDYRGYSQSVLRTLCARFAGPMNSQHLDPKSMQNDGAILPKRAQKAVLGVQAEA